MREVKKGYGTERRGGEREKGGSEVTTVRRGI